MTACAVSGTLPEAAANIMESSTNAAKK